MKKLMTMILLAAAVSAPSYAAENHKGCTFRPLEAGMGKCNNPSYLRCGGFLAGDVNVMGDLKMKVIQDVDQSSKQRFFTVIEVKAPGYHEQLTIYQTSDLDTSTATKRTICGKDVLFWLKKPSDLSVSVDDF